MKLQNFPRNFTISALNTAQFSSQGLPANKVYDETIVTKLLDRRWTLPKPDAKINQILISRTLGEHGNVALGNVSFSNNTDPPLGDNLIKVRNRRPSFYVVRDDLLHPLVNGNKARKLDGLFPLVEDYSATDLVTCGGCQSAHTAAIAVLCAERNLRAHLLLRGEQPEISTGYNLVSMLYGNVSYVPRSSYAKRVEMLSKHADLVAGDCGSIVWLNDILEASLSNRTSGQLNVHLVDTHRYEHSLKRVVVVNEGAGDAVGLLGVIRLVHFLSKDHLLGKKRAFKIVVDAGTGTTAIGLALGALCLGVPWEVHAVMLADNVDGYRRQEEMLISEFQKCFGFPFEVDQISSKENNTLVHWEERSSQRKFGNVLTGEVKVCQQIAQQTGVLVDPIYTFAAWELAMQLSEREGKGVTKVVMLHTGGTLGMFGLAQRYTSHFDLLSKDFTVQKQ